MGFSGGSDDCTRIDVDIADDAVVGGSIGVDILDVEGLTTGSIIEGLLDTMTAGDVVDTTGLLPAGALETALL